MQRDEFSFIYLLFSISDICVKSQQFIGLSNVVWIAAGHGKVVSMNKIGSAFSGIFLLICSGVPAATGAVELAAHEATYNMSLLSVDQDSQMAGIKGKTSFTIRRDCDGWKSSENYVLEFDYQSGETAIMASHFSSWEELAGQLYSFEVHEGSTFEDEKQFNGYANLPPVADRAEAFFSMQPDIAMPLPDKVLFPVAHTRELLDKAAQGGKLFSAHIFFGAEPDRALKRTSSVIGSRQSVDNEDRLGQLAARDYYPIQIAYFDPKSAEAVPEYEITFHMLPNGVVAYYEVDYGTFAIDAELVDAKPLPQPTCS